MGEGRLESQRREYGVVVGRWLVGIRQALVGSTLMSWAPIEISDITPHRKKTPEPQQNGQSTAGAVSNGSSNSRVATNGNM
ncbi:hypothetical protein ACFXTO_010415 [Malus domestica]